MRHASTPAAYRRWSTAYHSQLVREDIRDLTAIVSISSVETLFSLLPDRVGPPVAGRLVIHGTGDAHPGDADAVFVCVPTPITPPETPSASTSTTAVAGAGGATAETK